MPTRVKYPAATPALAEKRLGRLAADLQSLLESIDAVNVRAEYLSGAVQQLVTDALSAQLTPVDFPGYQRAVDMLGLLATLRVGLELAGRVLQAQCRHTTNRSGCALPSISEGGFCLKHYRYHRRRAQRDAAIESAASLRALT